MKFYKCWQPPQAISFDLDDTLYDNVPVMAQAEQVLQQWLAEQCEDFSGISVAQWADYRERSALLAPAMAQDMSALRLFTLMRAFLAKGFSKQRARELAAEGFQLFWQARNNFQVAPQTLQRLQQLGQRYPLVAITNGNASPERIGLSGVFQHVLSPKLYQLQLKPHTDLFRQAEALTGLKEAAWLHVGDHLISDVQGALNAGWQAAWFNPNREPLMGKTSFALPHLEYSCLGRLVSVLLQH